MCYFQGGLEATASFASPNIHRCTNNNCGNAILFPALGMSQSGSSILRGYYPRATPINIYPCFFEWSQMDSFSILTDRSLFLLLQLPLYLHLQNRALQKIILLPLPLPTLPISLTTLN